MEPYLIVAGYRFTQLEALSPLRQRLLERGRDLGLKGTILLGHEGINCTLSGLPAAIGAMKDTLHENCGLRDFKESWSKTQPFGRLLVRLKREIITMGEPEIAPAVEPEISPQDLRDWLDRGAEFTLLDTRNDYEVRIGSFRGARHLNLKTFREFPTRAATLPAALKDKPLVMFCTGGIRCEKAAPLMLQKLGFQQVYKLRGGLLQYFKDCGGAHFEGDCFVFDERVAVAPTLEPAPVVLCRACGNPLTLAEQQDPSYRPGETCRYCLDSSRRATP